MNPISMIALQTLFFMAKIDASVAAIELDRKALEARLL